MAIGAPYKHIFNRFSLLFFYWAIWCIEHSIIWMIIFQWMSLELVDFGLFMQSIGESQSWGFGVGLHFEVGVGSDWMLFDFSLFESHHFELLLETGNAPSVLLT
jgi:hypothetical protein